MRAFSYHRPRSSGEVCQLLASEPGARILAGGTCLVDLMKQGVETPEAVVDLAAVTELRRIAVLPSGGLRVGAAATLSHVARHEAVRAHWPLLHEAIVDGLTPQLRNAATFAGNLMQRPRCIYFREPGFRCNKRRPGSGCAAKEGVHFSHAVFGLDEATECIATHPSDLCVALTAFDATIDVVGADGAVRTLPIESLHRLPDGAPDRETTLSPTDLIVGIDVPGQAGRRGAYVKGTEGFALASCALLLQVDGERCNAARVALGGVAHKPWRAFAVERVLSGQTLDDALLARAADAAADGAQTDFQTAFRLPLLRGVVLEALQRALSRRQELRP